MKVSNLVYSVTPQWAHAPGNLVRMEESAPKMEIIRAVANVPLDTLEKIVKKVHTRLWILCWILWRKLCKKHILDCELCVNSSCNIGYISYL